MSEPYVEKKTKTKNNDTWTCSVLLKYRIRGRGYKRIIKHRRCDYCVLTLCKESESVHAPLAYRIDKIYFLPSLISPHVDFLSRASFEVGSSQSQDAGMKKILFKTYIYN